MPPRPVAGFERSNAFDKRFARYSPQLQEEAKEKVALFLKDSSDPSLENHEYLGRGAGLRTFRISKGKPVYVILFEYLPPVPPNTAEDAYFHATGTHQEVDRKANR